MKFNTIITLVSLSFFLTVTAELTAQSWEADLAPITGGINWMEQADDGTVVVGGPDAMTGIDAATGEIIWQDARLGKHNRSAVQFMSGMPLLLIEGSTNKKSKGYGKLAVVNVSDGKVIFSSKDAGVEVLERTLLNELNGMLFQLNTVGQLELAYYDLAAGVAKWKQPLREAGTSGRGVRTALELAPELSYDDALILALDEGIKAMEVKDGNVRWEREYGDEVSFISNSTDGLLTFVGVDRMLDVIATATGESQLSSPIELKANLIGVERSEDVYIIRTDRGINLYDPVSKTLKWDKSPYTGLSHEAYAIPGGYLTATKADGYVNMAKLDAKGEKVWKESARGNVLFFGPVGKGILYLTDARANILGFDDGKDYLKKDIKIKGTPAVALDEANNQMVIYSKETLTTFDLESAETVEIAEDIDLDRFDDKEMVAQVEVREDGYFISSPQHAALVTRDGKIKYNHYYKPVRLGAGTGLAMAAGSLAGVDVAGIQNTVGELKQMTGNAKTTSTTKVETVAAGLTVGSSPVFVATTARFYATQASKDNMYMFTSTKEGPALHRVEKAGGETEKEFPFSVKEPTYIVDEYGGILMYVEDDKVVAKTL